MANDTRRGAAIAALIVLSLSVWAGTNVMSHSAPPRPTDYVEARVMQEDVIPRTKLPQSRDGKSLAFVVWYRRAVKQEDLSIELTYQKKTREMYPEHEGWQVRMGSTLSGWAYVMKYDGSPVDFAVNLPPEQIYKDLNCMLFLIEPGPEPLDYDRAKGQVACGNPPDKKVG